MKIETPIERALRICNQNEMAAKFLCACAQWFHDIDDIVDGERTDPEHVIRTALVGSTVLVFHPFFQANAVVLSETLLLIANDYADSVAMERSGEKWKVQHADCLRHCGNLLVTKVAQLCGGYDHARTISMEQREITHAAQHPEEKENG